MNSDQIEIQHLEATLDQKGNGPARNGFSSSWTNYFWGCENAGIYEKVARIPFLLKVLNKGWKSTLQLHLDAFVSNPLKQRKWCVSVFTMLFCLAAINVFPYEKIHFSRTNYPKLACAWGLCVCSKSIPRLCSSRKYSWKNEKVPENWREMIVPCNHL